MKRIPLIEGLRGYLAIWVVFDHLLAISGYSVSKLNFFFKIIRSGWYAVDLFIIISGFVIFYLMDVKREKFTPFIFRRFFRLWPLFIVLFFISIPISTVIINNSIDFTELYNGIKIGDGQVESRVLSWRDNIHWHILAHIPMLHGIIPNSILPHSPSAFLGPAWSISLEWQFYIIAPLVFIIINRFKYLGLIMIIVLFLFLRFFVGVEADIEHGAFLPMHAEYFLLGILSYYIMKYVSNRKELLNGNVLFLIIVIVILFMMYNFQFEYLPYYIWFVCFTLILSSTQNKKSLLSRVSWAVFQTKPIEYLGKISYSIYLSHIIVIYLIQRIILSYFSGLTQKEHLILLSLFSILFTLLVSTITYRYIEKPLIRFGNKRVHYSNN